MRVPPNMTEEDVINEIRRVVNTLAHRFVFGYYDIDDIKQQGVIYGMAAMEKYDENRPLANFIYRHVKNRLINFKRDKYRRNDPPCKLCHTTGGHGEGQSTCDKYNSWRKRNMSKQNIMNPLDITNICDEKEPNTRTSSSVLEDIEVKEVLESIDEHLPVELRAVYLQMRQGESVPKAKRKEVEKAVLAILEGNPICQND